MSLLVEDVHVTYPGWPPTLRGADLEVPAGTSGFLLGPSGCGKSTLLRVIAGLQQPDRGLVRLDGRVLDGLPPHRRHVGMLFQEPALFPHLDVRQNVAFGLRYRGVPKADRAAEADRYLELVDLPGRGRSRMDELSGGQRQRVSLARTLAARPACVLLDEPLSSLDRDLRDELGPRIKRLLAEEGVPALWVTHDHGEAKRLGDRVWRMLEGRCVAEDGPSGA